VAFLILRKSVIADDGCVGTAVNVLISAARGTSFCANGVISCSVLLAVLTFERPAAAACLIKGARRVSDQDEVERENGAAVLSFPKIASGRIRAMKQNQRILRGDACDPPSAWDVCHQPVQVTAPA
jgi:hypothetical protein